MRTRKMIAALLALAVAGCDSQPTDPTPDEPTPAALGAATESNFEAVVEGLIWSSSDTTVVTVGPDGVVISCGNGEAVLEVSAQGVAAEVVARMAQEVASINLSRAADTVPRFEAAGLEASAAEG